MGQVRRTVVVAVIVLVALAALPGIGHAATGTWKIEKSTNRGGVSSGLADVSCPSVDKCVAVGAYRNDNPSTGPLPAGTLVETSSGGKWVTNGSPGQNGTSVLSSVSCPTTSRCYAVGTSHTSSDPFVVTSSGGGWTRMTTLTLPEESHLMSIDCADATHCVVVGSIGPEPTRALALGLVGTTWGVMATPDATGSEVLDDVSCATTTRCTAVGESISGGGSGEPIALQLAGGAWTATSPKVRNGNGRLLGVSCTAATRCSAVGYFYASGGDTRTLVETWSAGQWATVTSPNGPALDSALASIACRVASSCSAVGTDHGRALMLRLADGKWTRETAPPRSLVYTLHGIDCPSATSCVAVGGGFTATQFLSQTVVARRTGP